MNFIVLQVSKPTFHNCNTEIFTNRLLLQSDNIVKAGYFLFLLYLSLPRSGSRGSWEEWKWIGDIHAPAAAAAAKSLQSCPTLCDPIEGNPSGSPVPGILQARTLEWVAISFSNVWKWKAKVKVKSLSSVRLFTTPWTAAHQAPPSMGFSRQEYWSGVPLPSSSSWSLTKRGVWKAPHSLIQNYLNY